VPDISEAIHRVEEDRSWTVDEKRDGGETLEREYAEKSEKIHVIHQLLKAYALYSKDEQYVVQDGQIVIVDEFTGSDDAGPPLVGRAAPGGGGEGERDGEGRDADARDGHDPELLPDVRQAGRHDGYGRDGGGEFHQIYGLEVMVIPTNRPIVRDDRQDLVYKTKREKYNAIIEEIERLHRCSCRCWSARSAWTCRRRCRGC
jgi:preprotein translocase subunit SecA